MFWLHLAWQIRVTAKMLNLFLTLKIVIFLTGFDPKTDPYSYVVIQNIEVMMKNNARMKVCHCLLAKRHQDIIILRVSQVFL